MLFHIQMGMVDRGASVGEFSQFPREAEILFAPLTGLEVVSKPWIEGRTIVVDLRLSTNTKDLTIEEVIGKMKRSHIELIDLMLDDLGCSGAAAKALLPLSTMRTESNKVSAAHFNVAQYYREVTAKALGAQKAAMESLVDPASWEGSGEPPVEVAQKMRRVAGLQALALPSAWRPYPRPSPLAPHPSPLTPRPSPSPLARSRWSSRRHPRAPNAGHSRHFHE